MSWDKCSNKGCSSERTLVSRFCAPCHNLSASQHQLDRQRGEAALARMFERPAAPAEPEPTPTEPAPEGLPERLVDRSVDCNPMMTNRRREPLAIGTTAPGGDLRGSGVSGSAVRLDDLPPRAEPASERLAVLSSKLVTIPAGASGIVEVEAYERILAKRFCIWLPHAETEHDYNRVGLLEIVHLGCGLGVHGTSRGVGAPATLFQKLTPVPRAPIITMHNPLLFRLINHHSREAIGVAVTIECVVQESPCC